MIAINTVKKYIKDTYTYKIFAELWYQAIEALETIGHIGKNFAHALKYILTFKVNIRNTLEQSARFGFDSLPLSLSIVGLTGMIIALQVAHEMVKQGAGDYVGALVTSSIVKELGPIMGSFAIIFMVGSSMAAEIATMKVTEQIDAMKILKVDPIQYLIVPRILAGFFIMPFVITLANLTGIIGGMLSSNLTANLSVLTYIDAVWRGLSQHDIYVSLLKSSVFGGMIALISTSIGYQTEGGAIDVGRSTTKAVVWSFISVVIIDYLLSMIFFD